MIIFYNDDNKYNLIIMMGLILFRLNLICKKLKPNPVRLN